MAMATRRHARQELCGDAYLALLEPHTKYRIEGRQKIARLVTVHLQSTHTNTRSLVVVTHTNTRSWVVVCVSVVHEEINNKGERERKCLEHREVRRGR